MKHICGADHRERDEISRLRVLAGEIGFVISNQQARALLDHLSQVHEANQRLNLTRITDRDEAIIAHVLDSITVVRHLGVVEEGARLADLGSGGGFPGVPVALVTPARVTLVESISKKADFLEEVSEHFSQQAQIEVYGGRAEELAAESPETFDLVLARALSSLPSIVELAAPLLRPGGLFFALKGRPSSEEVDAGRRAAAQVGMEETGIVEFTLPVLGHRRTILTFRRVGEPLRQLPRRIGSAQKRPLA